LLLWTPDPNQVIDPRLPIVVNTETIRDFLANNSAPPPAQTYVGRIVLHEMLHRFGMPEGFGGGVMDGNNGLKDDASNALVDAQMDRIRRRLRP
jgi:hypothetical protein